uniref:BOD1/SHG1 domain-containing protein n=1 Tax=Cyclopterus lumpus TaxID=8103 RepID=A0A8C3A367_CYCLU
MEGLPPGDPQLVSMIVSHLKTQGLFDQFRRDCLADVDTKPAYLNLKQRVDNFVSNHLSNHTWSPHLNKNQLRNNIRQLVLQSGMLEQGVDRIVAQVVDPKVNHLFRPQVERVVREFLSPGSCSEEPPLPPPIMETKPDVSIPEPGTTLLISLSAMIFLLNIQINRVWLKLTLVMLNLYSLVVRSGYHFGQRRHVHPGHHNLSQPGGQRQGQLR